jgi:hypothetical protein
MHHHQHASTCVTFNSKTTTSKTTTNTKQLSPQLAAEQTPTAQAPTLSNPGILPPARSTNLHSYHSATGLFQTLCAHPI